MFNRAKPRQQRCLSLMGRIIMNSDFPLRRMQCSHLLEWGWIHFADRETPLESVSYEEKMVHSGGHLAAGRKGVHWRGYLKECGPQSLRETAFTAKALRNLEWPELLKNEQCSAMARWKELSLPLFWKKKKKTEEGMGGYAMGFGWNVFLMVALAVELGFIAHNTLQRPSSSRNNNAHLVVLLWRWNEIMDFSLGLIGADSALVLGHSNDQEQAWDYLLMKERLSEFLWCCINILDLG